MATQSLNFDVLARDRASRVFDKVGKSASDTEGHFHRLGKTMATVGKVAAVGLGAGIIAAAGSLHVMIAEARDSAAVNRITAARLKSTGDAAKVSAKHIGDLSQALSNQTGIDDEVIQRGQNMLLTFTNIRNEAGKGNKVFDQATRSLVDLSSAMGTDPQKAAIQLGKALNDPIKGITALTRVGVAFTTQQKDQIKALVQSGDTMGAQKIILHELNKEFGGTAVAASDPMQRLHTVLFNIAETLGTSLLPFLNQAATFLANNLPGAVATAQGVIKTFIDKVTGIVDTVIGVYQTAAPKVQAAFDSFVPDVQAIVGKITGKFQSVGNSIISAIRAGLATGDWSTLGDTIGNGIGVALSGGTGIGARLVAALAHVDWLNLGKQAGALAFPFIFGMIEGMLNAIIPFVLHHPLDVVSLALALIPIGRVSGVLEKLVSRLPWASKLLGPILRVLAGAGGRVEGAAGSAFRGILNALEHIAPEAVGAVRRLGNKVQYAVFSWAVDVAAAAGRVARGLLSGLTKPLAGIGDKFVGIGAEVVRGFIRGITGLAGAAANAAKSMAQSAINGAKSLLHIHSPSRVFIQIGEFVSQGFAEGIKKGGKKAVEAMQTVVDAVKTKVTDLRTQAQQIATTVGDSVRGVLDISRIGAAVESTTQVTTPGTPDTSVIDPLTGKFTTTPGTAATTTDVTTSTTPKITDTLAGFASQAKAFADALATMARKHLAPSLIAAVAAAGPVSGLSAAQALASASAADVTSVNRSIGQIDAAGNAAGQTVLKTTPLPAQIKREEETLATLQRIEAGLKSDNIAEIRVRNGDELYVVFKRAEKKAARR